VLRNEKVLVAGATGQVALPVALALARDNEVWAVARFSDTRARRTLEEVGVNCVSVDLVEGSLAGVPADFDCVVNFAVMKTNDWGDDLDGNAGGTGALMHHCATARAFLHCSTTRV
jgi:UDP-glucuronate 4-epimerase